MRVVLAGYNVDSSQLCKLDQTQATPESISAAYARISRSEKDVDILREEAIRDVSKARKSNENIIFDMGHASIAEHAVFNIDILGVSRYITEVLQRSRLASFTEKSQRYVTFKKDYIVPDELLRLDELKSGYIQICELLFEEYSKSIKVLTKRLAKAYPELGKRELETMAKEDARYILPLATKTQMGMTINARSLEVLLRRLSSTDLKEAKILHYFTHSLIHNIAPSLVRYGIEEKPMYRLDDALDTLPVPNAVFSDELPGATLLHSSHKKADDHILALMLFEQGGADPKAWQEQLGKMGKKEKAKIWEIVFKDITPWQKLPRAFEALELGYHLRLSECSWSQLKRHRTATLIKGKPEQYSPIIIPASIKACGRAERWVEIAEQTRSFRLGLDEKIRGYLRLNAEVVNVYAKLNLRELYHFTRLRSDLHAQWEIRQVSDIMMKLAKPFAPQAAGYLGGKSDFK